MRVGIAAGVLLLSSCGRDRSTYADEAAHLVEALFQVRSASGTRTAELERLQAAPCTEAGLCQIKQQCLAAYGAWTAATAQLMSIKERVAAAHTSAENERALAELLELERELAEANQETQTCLDAEGRLRLQHRL